MPVIRSAQKALRQSLRRRAQNLKRKDAYKSAVKEARKFIASGQKEEAEKLLPRVYAALDKAVKTNVIKKNKASRLKSRLTKTIAGRATPAAG